MFAASTLFRRISLKIFDYTMPYLCMMRVALPRLRPEKRMHELPGQLIVSLTSYPARYRYLYLTLKSIIAQKVKPDRIIVWIADGDMAKLPQNILRLNSYGVEIKSTVDLKSYKKIIPTLLSWPDAFIVTADDDVYYRKGWLSELVTSWSGNYSEVVCHRAHKITLLPDGDFQSYSKWEFESQTRGRSDLFFPTGVGGILYPPGSLHSSVLDVSDFLETCPSGDDIWLFWKARQAGSTTYNIAKWARPIEWPGTTETSLYQLNVYGNQNDNQIAAMSLRYGTPIKVSGK